MSRSYMNHTIALRCKSTNRFLFGHGCIKPGFTTDNYSIDKPIHFRLKQIVFEQHCVLAFSQVFRMTVT